MTDAGSTVSFATDIKPLFRQKDRNSMESHFDLWSLARRMAKRAEL